MKFNFAPEQSFGEGLIEAFAKQATRHESQIVDFDEYYEECRHILVGPKKEQFRGVGLDAGGNTVICLYDSRHDRYRVRSLSDFEQKDVSRIAREIETFIVGLQEERLMVCFDVYTNPDMIDFDIIDVIFVFEDMGKDRDYLFANMFAHGTKFIKGTGLVINGKKCELVDQFCDPVPPSKVMGYIVRDEATGQETKIPIDIFPADQAKILADRIRETNLF